MAQSQESTRKALSTPEIASKLERASVWLVVLAELVGVLQDGCKRIARILRGSTNAPDGAGS